MSRMRTERSRSAQDYKDMVFAIEMLEIQKARDIRLSANLTLVEMSKLVGTSHVTIARWETGIRMPRPDLATTYGRILRSLDTKSDSAGKVHDVSHASQDV